MWVHMMKELVGPGGGLLNKGYNTASHGVAEEYMSETQNGQLLLDYQFDRGKFQVYQITSN